MNMNAGKGMQIGALVGLYIVGRDISDGKFLPWDGSEAVSQNIVRAMGSILFTAVICYFLGAALGWGIGFYRRKSGKAEISASSGPTP